MRHAVKEEIGKGTQKYNAVFVIASILIFVLSRETKVMGILDMFYIANHLTAMLGDSKG